MIESPSAIRPPAAIDHKRRLEAEFASQRRLEAEFNSQRRLPSQFEAISVNALDDALVFRKEISPPFALLRQHSLPRARPP